MKIVIDSNVIISAFAGKGFCNELFELCLSEHDVYLSEYILDECVKNFKKKIKLPDSVTKEIINYLKTATKIVKPHKNISYTCRDKKDLEIIGTALTCHAEVIITGDIDLLETKKHKTINILSPREFWMYLKK